MEPNYNQLYVMRYYKAGEGVPCYSRLMSGSSCEGKAFIRKKLCEHLGVLSLLVNYGAKL